MAAGTYKTVKFQVPIMFTVADGLDGWAGSDDERALVVLASLQNAADQLAFSLPTSFSQAGKGLFESLEGQGVDIGEIRTTLIDGYPAREVDFRVGKTEGFGLVVFNFDGSTWFAASGNHLRLVQVDRGDKLFLVLAEVLEAHWPTTKSNIDDVIASLHFE